MSRHLWVVLAVIAQAVWAQELALQLLQLHVNVCHPQVPHILEMVALTMELLLPLLHLLQLPDQIVPATVIHYHQQLIHRLPILIIIDRLRGQVHDNPLLNVLLKTTTITTILLRYMAVERLLLIWTVQRVVQQCAPETLALAEHMIRVQMIVGLQWQRPLWLR